MIFQFHTQLLVLSASLSVLFAKPLTVLTRPEETAGRSHECRNPQTSTFDYSAKVRTAEDALICAASPIFGRQVTDDDYSCSESKPCSNGACCPKKTGYCNYGPDACGTSGQSPNDLCWSNCDAHSECGQYAKVPGAKCPLNVCCSEFGFCGTTSDFCTKGSDAKTGCQSNCDQPSSGASGGDVQARVIGYYEAWAHDRSCSGMDFKDIPVGGLTHLHFAFGYITPGDFNVAPMDGLQSSLFLDLTDLKQKNSDLKTIVALGGWTFTDSGTATQTVFSNIVSSASNRAKFITNLLSFLREYAFDGVDFDWEYPGAPDRGGHPDDGINFTQFLSELKDAIAKQPLPYIVSFTVPTSYWYLRWFDLKAVDHVDWVNVMSYDLHGTWDSTNPIGSHVLAHTNLTEIHQAFDLFWRNGVKADKLNLGLGFYGRSFQLSDPSCYRPGCNFKGGASPGSCTQNSGTLSYKEIKQIVDQNKLTPYYDEVAAVKYIVWNQDQWVSYDDEVTFKQKVDFANNLGLGGLLIWSIDQDTDDLQGLQAVLAPKSITAFAELSNDATYWQNDATPDCYVSDCGAPCETGFTLITHQPCGGAKPGSRHSKKADSNLCCPLSAAPDPKTCTWRGNEPYCNGRCHDNEVAVEMNRWGNGKYCEDGNKVYCCEVPNAEENKCYWTGVGGTCNSGDETLTFAGTFLETVVDIVKVFPPTLFGDALVTVLDGLDMDLEKRYCCPPNDAKKWTNCAWHGQPGNCFDNHCDVGHQVQLATNAHGLGLSCAPRLERDRVFCCDATSGKSPFLPVPLTDLFPHPPSGASVDSTFKLKVDNTWGTGSAKTSSEDPNDSTFGLVVLSSPEELQVSLDKRDGSHWELLNCNDAVSEEAQTIQMFCTDVSESSNCHKISLGHGVPGTILEMPEGCGPSKYAVAKSMSVATNQDLSKYVQKRNFAHEPVIYDLTFDYEWRRVPRDLGDTQMRLDYSNEVGYWNAIVNKPGSKKRKRSLEEVGGSHKRWLEEEWREDAHFGGLTARELHERWFGSDVVSWLTGFFNGDIKPEFTHNIDTTFTAKLIEEKWGPCKVGGVDVEAKLLVQALADIKVATSFGITIITKLSLPLDLSQSYLHFKNKGDVSAVFSLDAVGKAVFGTEDIELLGLQNFPGATFSIPKLVTVGPNFRLYGAVDAEIVIAGHLEAKVEIASWEIQQTLPDQSSDWDPKTLSPPDRSNTGSFDGIQRPDIDYSVTATGQITAHLKPTFEFGIKFDPMWKVDSAGVDVVADGWVRIMASAGVSSTGNCPFKYGIDVGADLYAIVTAPSAFGWSPAKFPIAAIDPKRAKKPESCSSSQKRSFYEHTPWSATPYIDARYNHSEHTLQKRAGIYGPLLKLPRSCFFCPQPEVNQKDCESITGWEPSQLSDPGANTKRDLPSSSRYNVFEKRDDRSTTFCKTKARMTIFPPAYDSSGPIVGRFPGIHTYDYTDKANCNDFGFDVIPTPANREGFATEHILELQLLGLFLQSQLTTKTYPNPDGGNDMNFCQYFQYYWYMSPRSLINMKIPVQAVFEQYPSRATNTGEFVLLADGVNTAKKGMWGDQAINADGTMNGYVGATPERAIKNVKDVLTAYRYHQIREIQTNLVAQSNRVRDMFNTMDTAILAKNPSYQQLNLGPLWSSWMRGRADSAKAKAETYMNQWVNRLQNGYGSALQRQNPDADLVTLLGRIDALATEVANVINGGWPNPL